MKLNIHFAEFQTADHYNLDPAVEDVCCRLSVKVAKSARDRKKDETPNRIKVSAEDNNHQHMNTDHLLESSS